VRLGRRGSAVGVAAASAVLVALLGAGDARAHNPFAEQATPLTQAVTLDGVMQPGEWTDAATFDFTPNPDEGRVWTKYDADFVYFAFRRVDLAAGTQAGFQIYFDNVHDGVQTMGDDLWLVDINPATGSTSAQDWWFASSAYSFTESQDTLGAATYTAGEAVFELRHPRCSADIGHDICIPADGSIVGANFFYLDNGDSTQLSHPAAFWNDQSTYGHFSLQVPPPPLDISVLGSSLLPASPREIAVNSTTDRAYVAVGNGVDNGSFHVSVREGTATIADIPAGAGDASTGPTHMAVNEATNRAYVTHTGSNFARAIDGVTSSSLGTFATGAYPEGIVANPATNRLYIANSNSGSVWVFDTAADANFAMAAIPIPGSGAGITNLYLAFAPPDRLYVTAPGLNKIFVVDTDTNGVVDEFAVPGTPSSIVASATTNRLYVKRDGTSDIAAIDATTGAVLATIALPGPPIDLALNPSLARLYVTTSGGEPDALVVIDTSTNTVLGLRQDLGATTLHTVAVNPANGRIYVTVQAPVHSVIVLADGSPPPPVAPNPRIHTSLTNDFVRFDGWNPDDTLDIQIGAFSGTAATNAEGWVQIDRSVHGQDIVAGTLIAANDATSSRSLTVEPVTVDALDPNTDSANGTASPNESLVVCLHAAGGTQLECVNAEAAGGGNWSVAFTADVVLGMTAYATVSDGDGDTSQGEFHLGSPFIHASLTNDYVFLFDFQPGETVHVEIGGYEADVTVNANGHANIERATHGQDLDVDTFISAAGQFTTKELFLDFVAIDELNPVADSIQGRSDPFAEVEVFVHAGGPTPFAQATVTADESGNWSHIFDEDIEYQMGASADIVDGDGDRSRADIFLQTPQIHASHMGDGIFLGGWAPNDSVHLQIGAFEMDVLTDGFGNAQVQPSAHGQNIQVGTLISAAQDFRSKTLTIEAITLDQPQGGQTSASGTAPPNRQVEVGVNQGANQIANVSTTSGGDGNWSVPLGLTLVGGMHVRADVIDEDFDRSRADSSVRAPTIGASLNGDNIFLEHWALGQVTVTIDGAERTVTIGENEFGTFGSLFNPQLGFDLVPGMVITATQNPTKTLTLVDMTATANPDTDTISGTAPAGSQVNVNIFGGPFRTVTASPTGTWSTSYAGTFDIQSGTQGDASVPDEDFDRTSFGFTVPPETVITSGPPGTSTNDGDTFTFSSPTPGVQFQCQVDGGLFQSCTSPRKIFVASGSHTFLVRAVLIGTPDPTPAQHSWTAAVPPPAAGSYRVDMPTGAVDNLDPARSFGVSGAWQILRATCATLLGHPDENGSMQIVPEAATALPEVSPDGMTYTITLRTGWAFADGTPLTAGGYREAIMRGIDPATGSPASFDYYSMIQGAAEYRDGAPDVSGVVVVDDSTLQITLTQPRYDFMQLLALPFYCPVPPGTPHMPLPSVPGSGPYTVASVAADEVLLQTNANYGGSRPQGLEAIEINLGVDQPQATARAIAGDSDYAVSSGPTQPDTDALYAAYGPGASPQRFFVNPSLNQAYLFFNTTRPGLDDVRIRRAINIALNRLTVRTALAGGQVHGGTPTDQFLHSGHPGFQDVGIYDFGGDLVQARQLVEEAGYTLAEPLTVNLRTTSGNAARAVTAPIIRDTLAQIGIDVEVQFFPAGQLFGTLLPNHEFDITLFNFIGDGGTAEFLRQIFRTGGSQNFGLFSEPSIDARIDAATATLPPDGDADWASIDQDLAAIHAPGAGLMAVNSRDLFSARMSCQEYHPLTGMSLAALCLAQQTYVVTNTNDSGPGSLRQAILDANGHAADDTIEFAIPGDDQAHTILLDSALPAITDPVTIDGESQPIGKVVLVGTGVAAGPGLQVDANASSVGGLVIRLFPGPGILVQGEGATIEGNYIGTDYTGLEEAPNGAGIRLEASNDNQIRDNLISGNTGNGIEVAGDGGDLNVIFDNRIGVSSSGGALGNGGHGIFVSSSDFTLIGDNNSLPEGVPSGGPNTIAHNGGDGVHVASGGGNRIVANSIHDNGELGIDLATGANGDQGAPEIQSIEFASVEEVNIVANFDAPRAGTYRVDYYANPACDTSGSGEGRRHLGHDLTTAVVGPSSIDSSSFGPVSVGDVITATVTGPGVDGNPDVPVNTSEFSTCFVVAAPSFVVTNTNSSGAGSLRQAILNANASLGSDTITFAIPGEGIRVINTTSSLPLITDPVTIDGTSQPGWFGPPVIRVDGAGQDGGTGLEVAANGSTIRGLMLTNMPNRALSLLSNGNTVAGNYIGTDGISGFEGPIGLYVSGSSNTIGGTSALDRNVISGFNWAVQIQDTCFEGCETGAVGTVVQGNYIGTNAAGTAALGNEYVGIELDDASDTTIAGNVISGTGYYAGIYVNAVSGTTAIQGNLIGVKADGIGLLPNQGPGIRIEDDGVLVGGTAPGAGNVIANNGQESVDTGIVVGSGTGNSILGNSIHDNVGLGISLGEVANSGQPAPVLEELLIGAGVTINGDLDDDNDTTYRIEFFSSPECDPSGFGEGETYLGFETVLTNDVGNASFTVNFPSAPLDGVITATATDPAGNTSAFSACLEEGIGEVSEGISLTSDEQSAKVGAQLVPLSAVGSEQLPSFAGSPSSAPVGSIPVGSIPVGSIPVGSIPVGSIPVGSIPVGSIPVGSIPVGSIPVGSIGLNAIPVGSIGLDQILLSMLPVDADTLLAGTPLFERPRQAITLADVYANDIARERFEALMLPDSGLMQSILAGVPFSAFLLGSATLNQLPPPDAATWCAAIEAAGGSCAGVSGTNTVLGLSIAGAPVGSIPVGSIPVGSIPVGSIPVGSIPVGSIDLEASRLAGVPVGSISNANKPLVLECGLSCPAGWTLGDADAANAILPGAQLKHLEGAFPPDLVLNDLIMGIVPRSALAWESFPIDGFQLFDESGITNTIRYRLRFTVTCPVPSDLSVRVTLPDGWLYKPGTTRWQYGTTATPIAGAEPTTSSKAGARWTSFPPDPCTGGVAAREVELSFQALSGFALGSEETTASVTMAGATQQSTGQAPVLVTQNWESNDAPGSAPTIAKDTLVIGHVAAAGDKEIFRLPIPAVRGTRTTFYLSHIAEDADFDLVIGKPAAPPLQSNPVGSIPVGSIPVEDGGSSVDNSREALPPETLQDIPVGSIPVGSISANRGSTDEVAQVVADGEQGFYTIVVSGYNGSHSDEPFVLRAVQTPPPTLPTCQPRSLALGPAGTLPASLPVATKTLFLVNQQRLAALYPNQSVPDMLAAATSVATSMGVEGAILPIDGSQAVRNAYAYWDTDPCSIDRANDVVAAINAVVAGYRADLPNLRYVVLLGTDEALPMMRRLDPVTISNETDEAPDLFFTTATAQGTRANALYSAAALGYFLSDTVYGAFTSVPWLGRDLYLPNLAVGRLVEGPLDIQRQLELYLSANGQLTTAKTLTTAYDFLTDGGEAVALALAGLGSTNATLIDDTWDAASLEAAFTDKSPPDDVLSVNAHYSHWLLQPAAGSTLVSTEALPAIQPGVEPEFARRILFTMGCHAGLNVADTLLPSSLNVRFQDWAQGWGQQRAAVYVANTGFGYGDTEANALSERLMSIFAEKLTQGGAIGERWVDAVHEYFATAGVYGVYDEKALTEATFYGLPFWRVGPDPAPPPAAGPPTDTGLGFAVAPETVTPSLTENVTPRGRFWDANGETLGIHYRPIQPRVAVDVTRTDWVATGALITELRTDDIGNVDPVNATPTIDSAEHEPEREFQPLIFPASPVTLTRSRGFTGDRQHAVVIAGQFRPDETGTSGTERLVRRIGLEIAYVQNPTDSTPPLIEQVAAVHTASATIFVKASEDAPGGVVRAAALWSDGTLNADGTLRWNFVQLAPVPGGWSAGPFDTAGPIQVIAMVQNANGLVAYSANKGVNFPSVTDAVGPEILVESPAPGAEYFLNEQVPVSFACSDAGVVTSCTSSPAGDLLDTATVGPKTLTVTATDVAGNPTTLEIPYTVIYRFTGFFAPVGNAPYMNQLKPGKAVPLHFSLSGDQGLSIFTTGYPASRQIVCDTSVPIETDVPTTTAGNSSLIYVARTDSYMYIWKTESSWANTCRRLIFKLADGKERYLDFKFVR
jgi:ABC-type transport system substrate-binding protein/DNA-binding beta-propeller fold protein YncE